VTTPQDVAIIDVRKEVSFCRKTALPILGVAENMAGLAMPINGLTFTAPSGRDVTAEVLACLPSALRPCMAHCDVFAASRGGAETMAREMGIPFLGRVPLDPALGRLAESGKSLQALKDAPSFQAFDAIVVGALSMYPPDTWECVDGDAMWIG
jgi:Mrp family chromosome partitioning ATPase